MIRTRSLSVVTGLFVLAACLLSAAHYRHEAQTLFAASDSRSPVSPARQQELLSAYGKLPLDFEQNQGQTDARVKFVARGNGYTLFLTGTDATLRLDTNSRFLKSQADQDGLFQPVSAARAREKRKSGILRLTLEGANHVAGVSGLQLQPGRSNYFIGNKPERWHRNVPHYGRVKYQSVYPGIDLIYYGNQGQLESDYVVSAGADPNRIAIHIDGAEHLNVDALGNLVLATAGGNLSLHQPIAYQEDAGTRKAVAARYILRGSRSVGIQVASYDSRQPLIIDPVVVYHTYLGGSAKDAALAIAVDSSGNAYVTGWTQSTDFPTVSPFQGTFGPQSINNNQETFVTKMNPTGTGLVYSTYLGGTGSTSNDQGNGIAVNSNGEAFVTGTTAAADFPFTSNAYQTQNPSTTNGTSFLTRLGATGSSLLYSTFFGGSGNEQGHAIALDASGFAYITGITTSTNFPFKNGIPNSGTTCSGTGGQAVGSDAFLSKFDTTQTGTGSLLYSTLLGGTCAQAGNAIAVEATSGVAYVGGNTTSTDFPTMNAFQTQQRGAAGGNAFVAKIDTTQIGQPGLLYASLLGGTGSGVGGGDIAHGLALGSAGNVFITGTTGSTDFPVFPNPGAFQTTQPSGLPKSAWVARFDTTKSGPASLIYSSYLGGSGFTVGNGIVVDSQNNAYATGNTSSNDFPFTAGAPQTVLKGQNAYVSVFNPTGTGLIFSTFWGGDGSDVAFGMAIDKANPPNIYIAGSTTSDVITFQTTPGAFQSVRNGLQDAFISKFTPATAASTVTLSPGVLAFGNQAVNTTSGPKTATLTNGGSSQVTNILISFSGTNNSDFAQSASGTTCTTTLAAGANCTIAVDFTPKTQAAESAALNVATSAGAAIANLSGTGTSAAGIVSVNPTTLSFGTLSLNTTSPPQTVTLTNNTATALAGIAITITGTNMADFANPAAGTTCTTTLPANASCTISVTFKPTLSSLEQAVLNIAFTGPTGSPQQVALSGTGTTATPDFSIVASPPTTTITAGQTATFTLTVTSMNGFSSAVTAACTGAPGNSTCTLTPNPVTPNANSTATINGSLATHAGTPLLPLFRIPFGPRFPVGVWRLLSLILALLAAWTATRRTTRKLAFAFGLLAILSLSGCSGLPHLGTQKGTYTVTVKATAGALTHPVTIMITVN